ncbi:hypothetical protein LJR118_001613 [Acidovorax sp. LjRoot118]|uniref:hypothetical protein n=1 Tax=Acidovorax sp. LjRoot118 TaxID=3342256 RepID=UPI003ECE097B
MHFTLPPLIQRAPARLSLTALCALSACVLAACGGGGDDPSGGLGSVSGVLSGLEQGKSLVLQNNGSDDLALSANGAFAFAQPMALGAAYAVTVKSQPVGQTCAVSNGNGTTAANNAGNVAVVCSLGSGGNGNKLAIGVPSLLGDWLENGCVTTGGQSYKRLVRATKKTDTSVWYSQIFHSYANGSCSGPNFSVMPQALGEVSFSRSESNDRIAANWGEFTTVNSTVLHAIWAKKSETVLCLLGDQKPSIQPTLEAVESSLATLSALGCFTKVP